MPEVALAV